MSNIKLKKCTSTWWKILKTSKKSNNFFLLRWHRKRLWRIPQSFSRSLYRGISLGAFERHVRATSRHLHLETLGKIRWKLSRKSRPRSSHRNVWNVQSHGRQKPEDLQDRSFLWSRFFSSRSWGKTGCQRVVFWSDTDWRHQQNCNQEGFLSKKQNDHLKHNH